MDIDLNFIKNNMTPKKKAKELVEKYDKNIVSINYKHMSKEAVIQCALIAVDEILQVDCCDMSESRFNDHI